jgi:hypothetical protein
LQAACDVHFHSILVLRTSIGSSPK